MSAAHVVLPPRRVHQSSCWYAECTCGETVVAESRDAAREAMRECRAAAAKRAESDRPTATPAATGKPAGTVGSAVKAEPPSSSLGGSAGHHDKPVTSAPESQYKADPVESPNRRESVS